MRREEGTRGSEGAAGAAQGGGAAPGLGRHLPGVLRDRQAQPRSGRPGARAGLQHDHVGWRREERGRPETPTSSSATRSSGWRSRCEQLVEYFRSAAQRLEVRKRILLLMGPVGGGKSTIVTLLKRGLERYSPHGRGRHLRHQGLPDARGAAAPDPGRAARRDRARSIGIYIEGDLCPHCRLRWCEHEYDGPGRGRAASQRIAFSEKHRIGIGTFTPSDPKSQDISELAGGIDLSTIGEVRRRSPTRGPTASTAS